MLSERSQKQSPHIAVPSYEMCLCVCSVAWLCLTLCNPVDLACRVLCPWNFPREFFPAKILERVALSYSRGIFSCRSQTCIFCVSCIGRQILYHCATWEAHEMYRIGKSTETETGLALARSWGGQGEQRVKTE